MCLRHLDLAAIGRELYGPWGGEMMFFHLIRKMHLKGRKETKAVPLRHAPRGLKI